MDNDKKYQSVKHFKSEITKIFNKHIDSTTNLPKVTPPFLKVSLGISNKTIEEWKKNAPNDNLAKRLLKNYNKAEKKALAFLIQDLCQNPKDSQGKLAIIKAYSKDFRDRENQLQEDTQKLISIRPSRKWEKNEI